MTCKQKLCITTKNKDFTLLLFVKVVLRYYKMLIPLNLLYLEFCLYYFVLYKAICRQGIKERSNYLTIYNKHLGKHFSPNNSYCFHWRLLLLDINILRLSYVACNGVWFYLKFCVFTCCRFCCQKKVNWISPIDNMQLNQS